MRVVLRLKMTKEVGGANVGCVKVKVGGGVDMEVLWSLLMEMKSH